MAEAFAGAPLRQFCRRHHISKLAVFGSILRDDFGPSSDVDILVEFEDGFTPGLEFFAMEHDLSDILRRKVDLNTAAFLGKHIRDRVLREAQVVFDAA